MVNTRMLNLIKEIIAAIENGEENFTTDWYPDHAIEKAGDAIYRATGVVLDRVDDGVYEIFR